MIPAIQDWAKGVYQNYSSLRADEVNPKLAKVILCAPALLALGTQAFGSLPLQPIIVTIAVADAFFHYVAVRNPEFCQKAKQYEWVFYGVRLAALTWSVGHLFQTLSNWTAAFPLTGASILKTYSIPRPDWLPYRSAPYGTHFFDSWILSWPVTIGGMVGMNSLVGKIHQWIAKEKVSSSQSIPWNRNSRKTIIGNSEESLPKAPLWVAVLQQAVYVSLAIFSKSHLVFAGLSGLNLYTFFKSVLYSRACLRQMIITLHFRKKFWENPRTVAQKSFKYEERFAAGKNVQEEVDSEILRLWQKVKAFVPFNFQQSNDGKSCSINCLEEPFLISDQSLSKQVSGGQLYVEALDQHIECKLIPLEYKQGMKIQVQIDKCNANSKFLNIPLDNGTIAQFLNVYTSQILKLGLKTIEATVDGIEIKYERLYLYCSSTELPKRENLVFTCNKEIRETPFTLDATVLICEKGQTQAPCFQCKSVSNLFYYESCEPYNAVCKSCIKADFENRVKNFTIVNKIICDDPSRHDPFSLRFGRVKLKVWAQKEQLPDGSTLRLTAPRGCVDIGWLDYPVGKKVNVQLKEVCEGLAFGLLPDDTLVYLPGDPEGANEMMQAQKTIEAQIISKYVSNDRLTLECISRALPPKSIRLTSTSYMQLRNGSPLQMDCTVDCKPTLSDQDEVCNICSNTSEILFYECADKTHTACLPCLSENFKVQYSNSKILNFRLRNQHGQIVNSYSSCFDRENLPNCLYCRAPIVESSQLSVCVQNVKTEVLILDYRIDDLVQFYIDGFFEDGTPYGELDDGTLVEVKDVPSTNVLLFFYQHMPCINAKILKKNIQNGQLCLTCTFISVEHL